MAPFREAAPRVLRDVGVERLLLPKQQECGVYRTHLEQFIRPAEPIDSILSIQELLGQWDYLI